MKPSIHKSEYRDQRYVPYFEERDRQVREANLSLGWMFIVFILAISFFIHTFVEPVVTPEHAKAESSIDYRDVHTEEQLKLWMSQHPTKVVTRI